MTKTPFKLKSGNSPLFKNLGSSPMTKTGDFAGIKDAEKRDKLINLYKHAEESKDDPKYWAEVKKVLGTTGTIKYQGKEY